MAAPIRSWGIRSARSPRRRSPPSASTSLGIRSSRSPRRPPLSHDAVEAVLENVYALASPDYVAKLVEARLAEERNWALETAQQQYWEAPPETDELPQSWDPKAGWYYQGTNADEAKFLCYRPPFARPPLPLTLVSEDFAQFKQDAMQGVPGEVDMDFAEEFWRRLHDPSYVTDHEQVVDDMVSKLVSAYLDAAVLPRFFLQGRSQADGVLLKDKLVVLVFEFKSEADKSWEPDFQVLDGFRRSCIRMMNITRGIRHHGLAVSVLGPRLEVWGVTVEGEKVWAEPLAETKCYGPDDYLLATASTWRAIRVFVQGFKAMPLVSPPVPWPIASERCVQRLNSGKLLFRYENSKGELEVAKFVSRYCLEAHKAWSGYAPEVYDFVERNGVTMIRMEYLSRERGWEPAGEIVDQVKGDPAHIAKLRRCIGDALAAGHSRDFVHGDFRLCNILLRKTEEVDGSLMYEVRILDFDWAGKLGQAAYPLMNKKIQWPPGARYGVAITKEHDLYFKDHLVEQLVENH